MNVIECFYVCLSAAGLVIPLLVLTFITAGLFLAYRMDRGLKPLFGAQVAMTVLISTSLASMECYMSNWVWFYMGVVLTGAAVLGLLRTFDRLRLERCSLGTFAGLEELEDEFGVAIVVLDTQRVRALAYRDTVYLSVGLLERLDDDQLRAVVAHEAYHLEARSPWMLSSLLALTSLTFLRYSDEHEADSHATRLVGGDALAGALERLEIVDRDDRASAL